MKYEELSKFKANINGVEFTDETICWTVADEIENMEDFFEIEINDTDYTRFLKNLVSEFEHSVKFAKESDYRAVMREFFLYISVAVQFDEEDVDKPSTAVIKTLVNKFKGNITNYKTNDIKDIATSLTGVESATYEQIYKAFFNRYAELSDVVSTLD